MRAHLRVNIKQLSYVICNTCNSQVQARSDRSDDLLRALHLKDDAPSMVPPVATHPPTAVAAAAAQAVQPQKPTPAAPSWGFFGGPTA